VVLEKEEVGNGPCLRIIHKSLKRLYKYSILNALSVLKLHNYPKSIKNTNYFTYVTVVLTDNEGTFGSLTKFK